VFNGFVPFPREGGKHKEAVGEGRWGEGGGVVKEPGYTSIIQGGEGPTSVSRKGRSRGLREEKGRNGRFPSRWGRPLFFVEKGSRCRSSSSRRR